jgi:hypothetical protein
MTSESAFSRGALEMTFQVLKSRHPELALMVRNILEGSRCNSDFFDIPLSKSQIATVLEALNQDLQSISDPGMQIVAVSLIDDWKQLE